MVKDLSEKVALILAKERQRVLGDLEFLGTPEQLDSSDVDLFKVNLASSEDFACNEVGLFVHAADVNDLGWREVRQDCRGGPDAKVLEEAFLLV